MIALAPIHENIRKTLSKRSQAVSRDFGGEDPLKSQNTKDTFKSTFSKAIWVRMFSPVNSTVESIDTKKKDKKGNPIFQKVEGSRKGLKYSTIFGGEVLGAGNERPLGGFEQIYANRSGTEKGILETVKGGLKRPMAGIKDISVSYKGGLSAIREAQINWSCWSFQDLNRLSPHFMAHGKGVLIEWGWSSPVGDNLIISNEEDMTNGTAYSLLQNRVIENEGNYDAMAGVVSNWDWALREDGGIDCTTTIVSRGVNMLNASLDNPGKPPDAGEDDEGPSMSLPEFMSAFRETLYTLSTKKGSWWEGVEDMKPITPISAHDSWTPGDEGGTQPPGIFTPVLPGLLFAEKKTGPFVTWGWFEDNVLSRFLGKYDGTGKTTASFRSIEPIMTPDNSGRFEGRDGDDEDANKIPAVGIHEADFQPVVIRNHKHLYSPFRDRWILPGQYPAQNTSYEQYESSLPWWLGGFVAEFIIDGVANLLYTNWDEDLTRMVAQSVQGLQSQNFESFTVDKTDWNKGGYLRNILIHWELLEESFKEAKTTKEGVNAILNEINSDVDGFWNFQIVTDPYIEGNVKIIDVNRTAHTVSDLLDDRKKHESADGSDEFGNPGSKLFTFPSWGEKSMVKSQNLSAKLPSSMQVTAMYSGTSSPTSADSAAAEGDDPGNAVGGLHGESVDDSQKDTRMAWEGSRMVNENVLGEGVTVQEFAPYGSKNPYNLESDLKKDTTIPSGTRFGFNKGIDFKFVDWYTIFGWGKDPATEFTDEDDKKLEKDEADRLKDSTEEKAKKNAAKTKEAKRHFHNVATAAGQFDGTGQKLTGKGPPPLKTHYAHGFSLYDEDGNMHSYPDDGIVFHEVMKDHIHGRVSGIPVEDRNKIDVLAPVELEITIDGCGGIIPGNAFHVDYIPEEYQKYCLFQVLSVDQSIGVDSWNTTIKGQIRIDSNRRISDKLGVIEKKEDDLDAKNEAEQEAYNEQQLAKEANRKDEEAAAADLAANPPDPPTEPGGTTSGT